ncbi:MAG: DUF2723 domain-containing protein [Dehalococcoidia bacterium]|nr:DUF2723 domain-containing protein [Dehalococcoidia bacterium]
MAPGPGLQRRTLTGMPAKAKSTRTGRRSAVLTFAALFAASLALYVLTMAPGITARNEGGDAGDFLVAAFKWGVPHPTGYPTYILGLRLFGWVVPIGDEAYTGNLFSAVAAALAVPFVFLAVRAVLGYLPEKAGDRRAAYLLALVSATAFSVSSVFWSQATITEVYALNALFVSVLLWLAIEIRVRLERAESVAAWMTVAALLLGLGLGNHVTIALAAFPVIVWVYWPALRARDWRVAPVFRPAAAMVAGLCVYAYPPIASAREPVLEWGQPHTWEGFKWMITGAIYRNYAFGVEGGRVLQRIVKVFDFLTGQYGYAGLVLGTAGLSVMWSRARGLAIATAASTLGVTVYAVGYSPGDSYVYLIPAFMMFAVWMGVGAASMAASLAQIARGTRRVWLHARERFILPAVALAAFAAGPAWILPAHFHSQDLSQDREAADYAANALETAGQGGVIFADGTQLFSLWYQTYIAAPELDVLIVSTSLLRFDWYWEDIRRQAPDRVPETPPVSYLDRLIAIASFNEGGAAVFLTHDDKFYSPRFTLEEDGGLFRATGLVAVGG